MALPIALPAWYLGTMAGGQAVGAGASIYGAYQQGRQQQEMLEYQREQDKIQNEMALAQIHQRQKEAAQANMLAKQNQRMQMARDVLSQQTAAFSMANKMKQQAYGLAEWYRTLGMRGGA